MTAKFAEIDGTPVAELEGRTATFRDAEGEIVAAGTLTGKINAKGAVGYTDDDGKRRWLAEAKIESIEVDEPEGVTPKDLAAEFDMTGKDLRVHLRSMFGKVGRGKRWHLTPDQVEKVREKLSAEK